MNKLLTTIMGLMILTPTAYAYGTVGMQEIGPDVCQIEFRAFDEEIYTVLQYCSTGEPYEQSMDDTPNTCYSTCDGPSPCF